MKLLLALVLVLSFVSVGFCQVKYVDGYTRMDGTPVRGYYRDCSNDGNPYNNANFMGYNR